LKIRIVIPTWKREAVTRFCFDELVKMIPKSKHEIKVTCAISEDSYRDICDEYGFEYVFVENDPLGKKINAGIKKALESEWDYLMMMNSDDVIDVSLLDEDYDQHLGKALFGVNRVTYVNFLTKEARDFTYSFSCLGIAKMIRRDVVEKAKGNLYRPELNRCLDDTMMDNLIHSQNILPVLVQYEGQKAWDFKSEVNIWSWDHFKNRGKEVCYSHE